MPMQEGQLIISTPSIKDRVSGGPETLHARFVTDDVVICLNMFYISY